MATYHDKAKLILQGRKNANLLVDILEEIDSASNDEVVEIISSLQVVFNFFLSRRLWHEQYESQICETAETFEPVEPSSSLESKGKDKEEVKETKIESDSTKHAERTYSLWVHQQYLTFVKDLLRLVCHRNQPVQRSAFDCLMCFLVADYHASISSPKYNGEQWYFPASLFFRIVDCIFFGEFNAFKAQLKYFEQRYLGFDDIQFYTLKSIYRIINGKSKSIRNNDNVKDAICCLLLRVLSYNKDEELKGFVIKDSDKLLKISKNSKERNKLFSNVWLSLLHLKLSKQSLKLILVNLHEKIMPVLEDPKLLIDFLTDCYSLEGPIGLLALNGLFLLIQNYNLDYPDFFKKLYNVLDAGTFEVKYRDKFLALTDLFLSSLNLPGYMAAAFIKKLARISLRVSPDAIKIILVMIENLMKRHPSCKVLIHRKVSAKVSTEEQVSADPYIPDETDPARCNALNSSLWELKTLEQHYSAEIQEAVKVFSQPFSRQERDLKPYLDSSFGDVFDKELTPFEDDESVLFTFDRPNQLFDSILYDDVFLSFE